MLAATTQQSSLENIQRRIAADMKLREPDPLLAFISELYKKGDLVTVDKGSRIPPLKVSVGAQFFGIKALKQTGVISRKLQYEISILDDDAQKEVEKYRTATTDILPKYSFSLADGSRWIPHSAKPLYQAELKRIHEEGSGRFKQIISDNPTNFVQSHKDTVAREAQQHYQEFHPGKEIPRDYIDWKRDSP